jgi:prepilin-type N-terminal cleavage/methylation domain-containing protein
MRLSSSHAIRTSYSAHRKTRALTLIELLAVIAIITILMSLLAPSFSALGGSARRRGAIDQLLTTFDQARVAAMRNASKVYIGFADFAFPVIDMRYRSYIVFRPRLKHDQPSCNAAGASQFVYLTKWRRLPQGISIKSEMKSIVGETGASVSVGPLDKFPNLTTGNLPVVVFNHIGGISQPSTSNLLKLYIYEGHFKGGRDIPAQANRHAFDVISIARFTGRPRLELASIDG